MLNSKLVEEMMFTRSIGCNRGAKINSQCYKSLFRSVLPFPFSFSNPSRIPDHLLTPTYREELEIPEQDKGG